MLPSRVCYSITVGHVLATMPYSLVIIGWEVLVSSTQAMITTCMFVMEQYFQCRQAFVEPGPEATTVAQSMEWEEADDRDDCAEAVVKAPEIGDQPYHPRRVSFPKVSFGRSSITVRSFQAVWFDKWKWLHWDNSTESVYSHICLRALRAGTLQCKTVDQAFLTRGFQNWKDATHLFRCHEQLACHCEAVERVLTLPTTIKHIGELLNSQAAENRKANCANLLHILNAVKFLARQGLPLRGSAFTKEADSNFSQLLFLLCKYNEHLPSWLANKYTSADIQNELLKVMALRILCEIVANIQNKSYPIMVDETTDVSTQKQGVVTLCWVDDDLEPHEDFIGLHVLDIPDADSIITLIKDTLIYLNLSLSLHPLLRSLSKPGLSRHHQRHQAPAACP